VPVNQLFGVSSGLGMSFITFDWTQIMWIGSPLMIPWWAEVHIFTGFVLFYWILTPILYYTNVSLFTRISSEMCIDLIYIVDLATLALPYHRKRTVRPLRPAVQRDTRVEAGRHLQPHCLCRILSPLPPRSVCHDIPLGVHAYDVCHRTHTLVPRAEPLKRDQADQSGAGRHSRQTHEELPGGPRLVVSPCLCVVFLLHYYCGGGVAHGGSGMGDVVSGVASVRICASVWVYFRYDWGRGESGLWLFCLVLM
jgi:hypothetical protein